MRTTVSIRSSGGGFLVWWRGALVAVVAVAAGAEAAETVGRPLRLGFSRRVLDAEVSLNDGLAAIRTHADAISRADNLPLEISRTLYESTEEIEEAVRRREVDLLAMLTVDYLAVRPELVTGPLLSAVIDGRTEDEYVLIVAGKSGVGTLADLRGRDITLFHNARSSLSALWLDVLTLRAGLGTAATFFRTMTEVGKPSQGVLPVFFGRQHAAVVTAQSLRLMQELNPQIGREIRVLEKSRPYLPSVMCFRAGGPTAEYERFVRAVLKMHTTTSGRQVTTIFKSERFVVIPPEAVQPVRELVAEHRRLLAGRPDGAATATGEEERRQP